MKYFFPNNILPLTRHPCAEWAAKKISLKSHLTLPPPPVINNDWSLGMDLPETRAAYL